MKNFSKSNWHSIEIDPEVFEMLQRYAKPLVDSANDVLRKLLFKEEITIDRKPQIVKKKIDNDSVLVDSATFVQFLLDERFGPGFESVGRYQYMFESNKEIVYFQNYNKEAYMLWYRIKKKPLDFLGSSKKRAWVGLTNPAEKYAYIIPVDKIESHVKSSNWTRQNLEVHIYPIESLWKELDWDISKYRYELKQP